MIVSEPAPPAQKEPPKDSGSGSPPPPPAPVGAAPPPASPVAGAVSKTNGIIRTATLRLKMLSVGSVKQVRMILARFLDPDHGDILQVIDPQSGKVVIDPKHGIRVETDKVADAMLELNLSDGKVHYAP
jgi:hypothetical protein